jgi:hypothetical protein
MRAAGLERGQKRCADGSGDAADEDSCHTKIDHIANHFSRRIDGGPSFGKIVSSEFPGEKTAGEDFEAIEEIRIQRGPDG